MPFITIITATYNSESYLQKSIDSIRKQNFKDFEYIIIDGGSKDGTLEIIKNNLDIVSNYLSEPDNGIYNAWNKGLKIATGDWIAFVGADDYYYPDALESYHTFIKAHSKEGNLYISSKVQIISNNGIALRVFGWPWEWKNFRRFNTIAHPGSLQSRNLYDQYGSYKENFKIVSDYEMLLRPREKLCALFMNKITMDVTEGGVSSKAKMFKEIRKVVVDTAGVDMITAYKDQYFSILKLTVKKMLRAFGVNVHLKRKF